jgi:hypothetical protein
MSSTHLQPRSDIIVPRDFIPKAFMGASIIEFCEKMILILGLVANPSAYRAKMLLQSQRFVNVVPPEPFEALERTGRLVHGMAEYSSRLGN